MFNLTSSSFLCALWIDIDGTLLDFQTASYLALRQTFEIYNLSWKEIYFDQFEEVNALLWNQIENQILDRPGLQEIRFPLLFHQLQLPLNDPEGFETKFSTLLHSSGILISGVVESLQTLQNDNLLLFIVTNGPSLGQRQRLEKANLSRFFKDMFISEVFQVSKPNHLFFEKAFEKTQMAYSSCDLLPKNIMIIGDSWRADIQGGLNFGTKAIWFYPKGRKAALESLDLISQDQAKKALCSQRLWIAQDWKEIVKIIQPQIDETSY